MADLHSKILEVSPLPHTPRSKFFHFHAVFRKFRQIRMLVPPWVGASTTGKYWIRHRIVNCQSRSNNKPQENEWMHCGIFLFYLFPFGIKTLHMRTLFKIFYLNTRMYFITFSYQELRSIVDDLKNENKVRFRFNRDSTQLNENIFNFFIYSWVFPNWIL